MSNKQRKKATPLYVAGLVIGALVMVAFTVLGILFMVSLRDVEKLHAFEAMVDSFGIGGWFILLAIQYIQIVLAFIPGGPIQIVAGALYGPWGGLGVCLGGTVLATLTIFGLVKKYGYRVIGTFVDEKDFLKYKFISDSKRLELLVLLLYLIPGTPKDALTYVFGLTPIDSRRFLALSVCARLPAMFTSILAGDYIIQGDWLKAGLLFLGIAVLSLGGLYLHYRIHRRQERKQHHNE